MKSSALKRLVMPKILTKFVDFARENDKVTQQGLEAALHIMLATCHGHGNLAQLVKSGAVHELIELGLSQLPSDNKNATELVLGILRQLCSRADGGAELLSHAARIAMVTEKIITAVSPAADDMALEILTEVFRFLARGGVVREMVRVGTVGKLRQLIQSRCSLALKEKAKDILRTHFCVWKNSHCVGVPTLI
ncbi:unnamed protein product [Cuscuta campestris]|uniref:U-box domain-containing protein n=1 Tax=Cuscuta campestris TaxID=132261 RepID=A0A484LCS1_9ASTE|nr:unnamed protein product [Cuscuta campestris]